MTKEEMKNYAIETIENMEDLLEQTKKELANCKEEEVSELKAKLRLLNDYLHRNIKGTK